VIRKRVRARGHVQGVFFRDTVRRKAQQRGVAGWVRNCGDGSVEAVLEGEPGAVESLVEFMRRGPRGALVEQVEAVDEEPERVGGFEIR
jgi:acylphosphatase